jgi:hypothetical protein
MKPWAPREILMLPANGMTLCGTLASRNHVYKEALMPASWIEVADTAIKIGLGSLVTGLSAYFLARTNHLHSLRRDMTLKRVAILESACAAAEEYFSYCTHMYNVVGGMTVIGDGEARFQKPEEWAVVDDIERDLRTALDARNKARAQVSMLGVEDALDALTKFNDTLSGFRKIVATSRTVPSAEQFGAITTEFRVHKRSFYAAAASFLTKLERG